MEIITRFAPSPTGMLHIGGARTALFNYLFARHYGGKFLLRIEDTDVKRSNPEAKDAILEGLQWLNIHWDDSIFYQSAQQTRHVAMAMQMVKDGTAYYDYSTADNDNLPTAEQNLSPAVRLKVPNGTTVIKDMVYGTVTFNHKDINDIVLLRSDGTPTYMLAVVVDDIDMGISHIIRGDDHLSNTAKQILIYQALKSPIPQFAHISLIHDIEGKKLSKRHDAIAVGSYKDMGYLPTAVCNYLMQLGWSPETADLDDNNIMSISEAIARFDIKRVGRSPSRFDFEKLNYINLQYIKNLDNNVLLQHIEPQLLKKIERPISAIEKVRLLRALDELKKQKTLNAVADTALCYLDNFTEWLTEGAKQLLLQHVDIVNALMQLSASWKEHDFLSALQALIAQRQWKMRDVGPVIRSLVIGCTDSVAISSMVQILGTPEVIRRIQEVGAKYSSAENR